MSRLRIDLHRHLEGSIRPEILLEIAREYRVPIVSDRLEDLRSQMRMTAAGHLNLPTFLLKFAVLRPFWVHRGAIERAARGAVEDAAREGVRHLELRFNPSFFSLERNFDPREVGRWICAAARCEARLRGIGVEFVGCVIRHLPPEMNRPVLDLAFEGEWFAGLDLAGHEGMADGLEYAPEFRRAREHSLGITVHAGELRGTGRNVRAAIERFQASRIGHGLCALRDPRLLDEVFDAGVTLEICPTSNRLTGQVREDSSHPAWRTEGVPMVLGTDDPAIFGTDLAAEEAIAVQGGLDLKVCRSRACQVAFLTQIDRTSLRKKVSD